ncbi:hypothetical protein CLCR_07805 [Cladophialophora carrionii]|uniref:Uncharacterized protein n=1 Tax=Cladophialophora carrionii TaxID=86049 RepID=A0A1C1CPJ0_9EURO|nr:hypothetical protein CLCR_07805 [Cladophialophora carrionii]
MAVATSFVGRREETTSLLFIDQVDHVLYIIPGRLSPEGLGSAAGAARLGSKVAAVWLEVPKSARISRYSDLSTATLKDGKFEFSIQIELGLRW